MEFSTPLLGFVASCQRNRLLVVIQKAYPRAAYPDRTSLTLYNDHVGAVPGVSMDLYPCHVSEWNQSQCELPYRINELQSRLSMIDDPSGGDPLSIAMQMIQRGKYPCKTAACRHSSEVIRGLSPKQNCCHQWHLLKLSDKYHRQLLPSSDPSKYPMLAIATC